MTDVHQGPAGGRRDGAGGGRSPTCVIARLDRAIATRSFERMSSYYVYILATRKDGPLYVGVTSDLSRRLEQHQAPSSQSFTGRYNVHRLVHVEVYDDPSLAIQREKRLKKGPRAWKVALFERDNPEWLDRIAGFLG